MCDDVNRNNCDVRPMHLLWPYSYLWGIGADHFGRKPVMILSSVLMALTSVGFGFSINFGMAVAMRFIVGAANGKCTLSSTIAMLHLTKSRQNCPMSG